MDATQKAPYLLNAISIVDNVLVKKILEVPIVKNASMIILSVTFRTVPVSIIILISKICIKDIRTRMDQDIYEVTY